MVSDKLGISAAAVPGRGFFPHEKLNVVNTTTSTKAQFALVHTHLFINIHSVSCFNTVQSIIALAGLHSKPPDCVSLSGILISNSRHNHVYVPDRALVLVHYPLHRVHNSWVTKCMYLVTFTHQCCLRAQQLILPFA